MMKRIKLLVLAIVLLGGIATSCFEDQDDVSASNYDIRDFIWKGLNLYYLYLDDVPDLADDRFATQTELDQFGVTFSSPEDWFDHLIADQDRFSWIVSDYIALEQSFSGVSLRNGMDFGLTFAPNGTDVIGFVKYVLPGSNAEINGVERGMIFNGIDGTLLTEANFNALLSPSSYAINLAELSGSEVISLNTSISLTKIEFTENPVFINETLVVNSSNVGYLMYNQFTSNFDAQLNNAFGTFQANGVTDLVLDLRYNSGGSVASAIQLSSMITGQFTGEVFTTEQWNSKVQAALIQYEQENNVELLTNRFVNTLTSGAAINSLNLNRVYVLTTSNSASASELVINALNPYIDVIQIGTTTTGKYQASITLYDSADFGREGANPAHTYAIQPLVLKEVNALGFTDYDDGLSPDPIFTLEENLANMGVLGDVNEPLLARAIQHISGLGFAPLTTSEFPINPIYHSNTNHLLANKMFIEKELPSDLIFRLQ
jgi:hypothetical protein